MYVKNRRNSSKFNAFGSYQTLCLTESVVLLTLVKHLKKKNI